MEQRRDGLPGLRWVIALIGLGVGAAALILLGKGSSDSWAAVLGPAAQTLLAAIVAAFGVTQILIARESVRVTEDQNEIMREQTAHAVRDSEARSLEAKQALEVATHGWLDSFAPQIALIGRKGRFGYPEDIPEALIQQAQSEPNSEPWTLRYEVHATLVNYGPAPVRFNATVNSPFFLVSPISAVAMPGETQIYITRDHPPQHWLGYKDEHEQRFRTSGDDSFLALKVEVSGTSRFVHDTHVLAAGPPRIRRGDNDVIETDREVEVDKLGIDNRLYVDAM